MAKETDRTTLLCVHCGAKGEVYTETTQEDRSYVFYRKFSCGDCGYSERLEKVIDHGSK